MAPASRLERAARGRYRGLRFLKFVDLADELHIRMRGYHWRDFLIPIALIGGVDLGGHLQGDAGPGGDFDSLIRPFSGEIRPRNAK